MGIFSFLFKKKIVKSHKQDWLDINEEMGKMEEEVTSPSALDDKAWNEFLEEAKVVKPIVIDEDEDEVLTPINLEVLEEDKEEDEQKKKNVEKTKKPVKSSTKSSKTKVDKFNKSNYTFNEKGIGDFKKGDMVLWNRKVSEIESIKGKKAQICTIIKGERVCKLVLLSSLCLATIK